MPPERNPSEPAMRDRVFATTSWTVVLNAQRGDSPGSAAALDQLCRTYWYPLYAYVRRRGHSHEDAQDLIQSFLVSLLHRGSLRSVVKEKGRFRSFLLAALSHFLADEWDKARAQKRGGGQIIISLDDQDADGRYQAEPAAPRSPEELFDRGFALAVLDTALGRLHQEHDGRQKQFAVLQQFLGEMPSEGAYERAGLELNLTPGAVRVAVHRLRQRYRELVWAEISGTVSSLSEVEDELSLLLHALRG